MKKSFSYFLLLLSCFFIQCKSKSPADKKHKVAIVVSTLNNPWFVFLANTAAEKAQVLGYEAKIFDSQNNTALESDHFENVIVAGFEAILFNSTDADGSVANVLKAKAAGVPVFCMDREINSNTAATSQILSDNNTWARSKGFHSVVDNYPGLKMVAQQSADFDRNKAMEVMESILQAHPNIDAVFCGNDGMAMGAYQALVSSGKADKVKVFGFDGAEDVITAINENKIAATGMQFPKVMAETAAQFADEYIKGRRDFPQKIPVAVELVTFKNIQDYIAYGKK